jgi:4a-hydroxytetrahydrobiopterin dehydratase
MTLADQKIEAISGDTKPLSVEEAKRMSADLPDWQLDEDGDELKQKFSFENFRQAMTFVNRIADLAEENDHHPDIEISYNTVELEFTTHKIEGLSKNDFIMAAKVSKLVGQ